MSRDPFAGLVAEVRTHSVVQAAKERCIAAYKNNIAPPDLHIADRNEEFVPKVLGEDGKELTWERRQALMEGRTPMLDDQRRVRGMDPFAAPAENYQASAEGRIETEELGASAIANRPPIRIVKPRSLDLPQEPINDPQAR